MESTARRKTGGRGSTRRRTRPSSGAAPAAGERSEPSEQVLARAAAIRETASRFARDGSSEGSSESEEEEEAGGREVVERLLKIYYQDLGSGGS